MKEMRFKGLIAPVFTPFTTSFDLDLDKIPAYARYLDGQNIKGVLVNGTTGEGVSMTGEERRQVTKAWVEVCKFTGQEVMVQVGGCSLMETCLLAKHAEELGVCSILCLPDLFFRPKTARELVEYLAVVGKSAPRTPLFYYHIPSFTGVEIDMEEFLREGRHKIPSLAGLKFTHTNLEEGARCLAVDPERFTIFLGADQILAGACVLGFDSAIATSLNIYPQLSHDIVKHIQNGELLQAQEVQRFLSYYIRKITQHGSWVSTMKAAMRCVLGMDLGPPRPPLISLTEEEERLMKEDCPALSGRA